MLGISVRCVEHCQELMDSRGSAGRCCILRTRDIEEDELYSDDDESELDEEDEEYWSSDELGIDPEDLYDAADGI